MTGTSNKSQSKIGNKLKITICILSILLYSCQDSKVIWSEKLASPDDRWVATAATTQYGGPGTAGVQTSVYLKQINVSSAPLLILELTNSSAYPSGITKLSMTWPTQRHLNIIYKGSVTIDFQAIKCAGIDVTVQEYGN